MSQFEIVAPSEQVARYLRSELLRGGGAGKCPERRCWRRILRWVANVSQGKKDLRQMLTAAEFVRGGTIGPVGGGSAAENTIPG